MTTRHYLPIIVGTMLMAPAVPGQETAKAKLSQARLGEVISGPKVDLSQMKGKVVAFEQWGRN